MSTKKKLIIGLTSLSLVLVLGLVTGLVIFAATRHTFSSNLSASFVATDISGEVTAQYNLEGNTPIDMTVNGQAGGSKVAKFIGNNQTQVMTLNPQTTELRLDRDKSLNFTYVFKNIGDNPYYIKVMYPTNKKNIKVVLVKDSEAPINITSRSGSIFTVPKNNAGSPGVLRLVVKVSVINAARDASFIGEFNFNLTKDEPELTFDMLPDMPLTFKGLEEDKMTEATEEANIKSYNAVSAPYASITEDCQIIVPDTYNGKPVTGLDISPSLYETPESAIGMDISPNIRRIYLGKNYSYCGYPGETDSISVALMNKNFEEIEVDPENTVFKSDGNCVLDIETHSVYGICKNSIIPDYATRIAAGCGLYCQGITSLVIPDSVQTIEFYALLYCSNLTSITIGSGLSSDFVLGGSPKLESIVVSPNNPNYKSEGNCLLTKDGSKLVFGCNKSVIPNNVITIGTAAFGECAGLTDLVLPDTVTTIEASAFSNCGNITNLKLSKNLETIEEDAFSNCSKITDLVIPDSVKTISDRAFSYCSGLVNIKIGSGVQLIGNGTFSGCNAIKKVNITNLVGWCGFNLEYSNLSYSDLYLNDVLITELVIPDEVTKISKNVFSGCSKLTSVKIGNGVKIIDSRAFASCNNLENLVIGNSVTQIEWLAFSGCGIRELNIPNSVQFIGQDAFNACRNLQTVTIGSGVTSLGYDSFKNCSQLKRVNLNSTNMKKDNINSSYLLKNPGTSLYIGTGVTTIGDYFFENSSGLTSVNIPETVSSIGIDPFKRCDNLSSILIDGNNTHYKSENNCIISEPDKILIGAYNGDIIPNGVLGIGEYVFYGRDTLINLVIPNSVVTIGPYAFSRCKNLKKVVIGDNVTTIDEWAFGNCEVLDDITLGASLTKIIRFAFEGCDKPKKLTINSQYFVENVRGWTIPAIQELYIGEGIETIGRSIFYNKQTITSVHFPQSLKVIGDSSFRECHGLTSIVIPDNVTEIKGGAFTCCNNLTNVTLGNSVKVVGFIAFNQCPKLKHIRIPNSLETVGRSAFGNSELETNPFGGGNYLGNETYPYLCLFDIADTSITSLNIHSTTKLILNAFYGCSSITSLTVETGNQYFKVEGNCILTIDGTTLVRGCASSIIPETVTTIREGALASINNIASIVIGQNITQIGDFAFSDCLNLKTVIIDSVTIAQNKLGNSQLLNNATTLYIKDTITNIHSSVTSGFTKQQTSDKAGYFKYTK